MGNRNKMEGHPIYPNIQTAIEAARGKRETVLFRDPVTGDDDLHALEIAENGSLAISGLIPKSGEVISTDNSQLPGPQIIFKHK